MQIPFNRPYLAGKELEFIINANHRLQLSGDGYFTKQCHQWLEQQLHAYKALLTHSCTAALEMSAILLNIQPGDEIIIPSYTFVSTANAFVLRGATPVFVDIREDTLNIDETRLEAAVSPRTKAIVPVHYAGVSCEMNVIGDIASRYQLDIVEDAAQGIFSTYNNQHLGTIGSLGCLSFHETKNVISGEGGALLINNVQFGERAEIIREKGTNRSRFFRGQVDKYTWVDIGSSYLPGELIAAFLAAQLEQSESITNKRLSIWNMYHSALQHLEQQERLRRPIVPQHCQHNAHMYYILLNNLAERTRFIQYMKSRGISSVFHYVPLHNSPAGLHFGRTSGSMDRTERIADTIVRLPLWIGIEEHIPTIVAAIHDFFRQDA
jgi:dTDP-4-amino-4,6-dideoxygalactose transaminase